jgi:hypothetical protein
MASQRGGGIIRRSYFLFGSAPTINIKLSFWKKNHKQLEKFIRFICTICTFLFTNKPNQRKSHIIFNCN